MRTEPEFGSVIHRLIERVWILGRLYQGWPADWDCRERLDTARLIRLVDWDWRYQDLQRRSSRTKQQWR